MNEQIEMQSVVQNLHLVTATRKTNSYLHLSSLGLLKCKLFKNVLAFDLKNKQKVNPNEHYGTSYWSLMFVDYSINFSSKSFIDTANALKIEFVILHDNVFNFLKTYIFYSCSTKQIP